MLIKLNISITKTLLNAPLSFRSARRIVPRRVTGTCARHQRELTGCNQTCKTGCSAAIRQRLIDFLRKLKAHRKIAVCFFVILCRKFDAAYKMIAVKRRPAAERPCRCFHCPPVLKRKIRQSVFCHRVFLHRGGYPEALRFCAPLFALAWRT